MKIARWFIILMLFITFIFPVVLKGQEGFIAPQNRFQIAVYNGTIANQSTLLAGKYSPEKAMSFSHSIRFSYDRLLNDRFSLQAGLGLGFQAANFLVYPWEGYQGSLGFGYNYTANYSMFQEMHTQIGYRLPLAIRPEVRLVTGGGVLHLSSGGFGINGGGFVGPEDYYISGINNGGLSPYITWGAQALLPLKNRNRVALIVGYKHHFTDWYTGIYRMHEGTSHGLIHSTGSGFQLGLGYMFTGEKRAEKLHSLEKEYGARKEARKALLKTHRIIDPGAKFISIYGGGCFLGYGVDDPNSLFVSYYHVTLKPRISFEYGLSSGLFLETGYHYTKHEADPVIRPVFQNISDNYSESAFGDGFSDIYIHNLSLGMGIRVTTKNQSPILNVSAGMFSGFHTKSPGDNGHGFGSIQYNYTCGVDSCSGDFLVYDFYSRIKSSMSFGVYGAISRDFRIAENLYLSLKYQYQLGLNTMAETDYYYWDSVSGIKGAAVGALRNTSHAALVGIRFLW